MTSDRGLSDNAAESSEDESPEYYHPSVKEEFTRCDCMILGALCFCLIAYVLAILFFVIGQPV